MPRQYHKPTEEISPANKLIRCQSCKLDKPLYEYGIRWTTRHHRGVTVEIMAPLTRTCRACREAYDRATRFYMAYDPTGDFTCASSFDLSDLAHMLYQGVLEPGTTLRRDGILYTVYGLQGERQRLVSAVGVSYCLAKTGVSLVKAQEVESCPTPAK